MNRSKIRTSKEFFIFLLSHFETFVTTEKEQVSSGLKITTSLSVGELISIVGLSLAGKALSLEKAGYYRKDIMIIALSES